MTPAPGRVLSVLCILSVAWAAPGLAGAPSGPYRPDAFTSLLLHFDEGQGETAADAGEFGIPCSLREAKWAEGRFGGGLDCRKGAVSVAVHPALCPENEVTIEAWVWVEKASDEIQRIAYRSGVYGLYLNAQGTSLTFYVTTGGLWEAAHARVPLKRWVHLAGVYDGRQMRVCVDGELKDQRDKAGSIAGSRSALEIGGEAGAGRRYLQGRIDEVRVSHIARTRFDPRERLAFTATAKARPIPPPKDPLRLTVPTLTVGRAAAPPKLDGSLDDPLWKHAARIGLDDLRGGARVTQPTQAWAAWDEGRLYVAARCAESRMSRILANVKRPDGPVWQDDCVELFVKPDPRQRTYFHIAANALGTVFDARCPPADKAWQSGARVAAARDARSWSVEMVIPFAAFGGPPKLGSRWRLNVCREEKPSKENASWAPVGGKFHSPGKFGWLEFAEKPVERQTVTTTVQGLLVDEEGRRVQGVAVGTAVGTRYSNALGLFRAEALPRGRNTFVVATPRYDAAAVEVDLKQPFERIALPPLRRVDPNALQVTVPPSNRGYRVYAVPPLDDLDPAELPPKEWENAPLTAFASPGEFEPLGAAIYAARKLSSVRVEVSELRHSTAARISGRDLDLRVVKRYLRRRRYNSSPDDAVFSSRYLLRPKPFDMAPNTFRRLHLIVRVPKGSRPGTYRGTLRIRPEGAPAAELPVALDVLDIELGPPRKHYSAYYYGRHTGRSEAEAEAVIRRELADLRAHGADRLLWRPRISYRKEGDRIVPDYESVRKHVALLREFGFQPPYLVWTGLEHLARLMGSEESEEFLRTGEQALRGLVELGKKEGWGEVAVTHMDEVFGRDRFERYVRLTRAVRRVPGLRMYITFHSRPTPEVAEMTRRINPFVDIRGYHGHSIDMWLAADHSFEELTALLKQSGDEAWCYYNPRSVDVTPEWQRIVNGLWLWLGPITTHCPWIYNSYRGDPLDDADGFDFGYAFPVGDEIVPTRLWEAYREGVDDCRYLSTLEALIARRKGDPRYGDAVRGAQVFLNALRHQLLAIPLEVEQSVLVRGIAERYAAADYNRWRRTCARHIHALQSAAQRP